MTRRLPAYETPKETQTIEWKESWRDEYIRLVCGFANAQGGTLIIGKNDKGVVLGVANAKKLLEDIPNKIRNILGIIVDVNLRVEQGKELLEIVVEPYPNPISYKGEYFYRTGSTKQELKGAALDKFLLKKQGKHWNDGQLPENWTVAQLLSKHASKPFNPLIANAFFRAGMIESWGRGIEKINQECEAAGVPVPEYRTDASGLMVQFHTGIRREEEVTKKMTKKMTKKTPEEVIALLQADGSLSIAALAEQIGASASTVDRVLHKLRESGIIERVGPDKGGHWVVKEKP
jgi:predicted HTH transcriptional regulator